jgi:DNA polymerase III alpha subunit
MGRITPKSPQMRLRANQIEAIEQAGGFDRYFERDLPLREVQQLEKSLLKVILTDNCEEILAYHSEQVANCNLYLDLDTTDTGVKVDIPGIVASVSEKRTKRDGKAMGIVTVEYQGDEVEFVVFPREWKAYKFMWRERTPGIFSLMKTDRGIHFDKGVGLSDTE